MARTILLGVALLGCVLAEVASAQTARPVPADEMNRRIGVGINLGSAIESPDYYNRQDIPESRWSGGVITEEDIERIRQAGFDSVRIPVRWYPYAVADGGGTQIPEYWFNEVEQVIDWVLERDMVAVLNQHHENPLFEDPSPAMLDRFVGFWEQIANRYQDKPENLVFELLNEPHGKITSEQLNDIYARAFTKIRQTNPTRVVVMGGNRWNSWYHTINEMELPDDPYIILTFHRYSPNDFTHQGFSGREVGVSFEDEIDGKPVAEHATTGFDEMAAYSKQTGKPVYVGEFGASVYTNQADAIKYERLVAEEARKRGFSIAIWSYHDQHFGIWDREFDNAWHQEAVDMLMQVKQMPMGKPDAAAQSSEETR